MSTFSDEIKKRQIRWRYQFLPDVHGSGHWRGKPYPHILPESCAWNRTLWPPLLNPPHSLPLYLDSNKIQRNTCCHHLNSSWVLAANLYFPFRATVSGRTLLAGFLKTHVASDIESVELVELEFEATEDHLKPKSLLGEVGGSRGKGQTSPDVVFIVRTAGGKPGVVLTECKYTEKSFYNCSAFTNRSLNGRMPNPDPSRCLNLSSLLRNHQANCHQFAWGRNYWDYIQLAPSATGSLKACPASRGAYQLFRQQALAEGLAGSASYDLVVSTVAFDPGNAPLLCSLQPLGVHSFEKDWAPMFTGKAHFRTFHHKDWVSWVRNHDAPAVWADWLRYIEDRYGY